MPNLRRLIISHNRINQLVIENCPQLDQSLFYTYKSGDPSRQAPADAKEYNEETDNPIQQAERAEDKILAQIIKLIAQAELALQQKDYSQLAQLVKQLKALASQAGTALKLDNFNDKVNRFEQACLTQENTTLTQNHWPLIIGSVLTLLSLGIIFYLVNKSIKKSFSRM